MRLRVSAPPFAALLALLLAPGCRSAQDPSSGPAFLLKAPPATVRLPRGGVAHLDVWLVRLEGHTEEVHLDVDRLPGGITAQGLVHRGAASGTLTLVAAPDAPPGPARPVQLRGLSGATTATTEFPLEVVAGAAPPWPRR